MNYKSKSAERAFIATHFTASGQQVALDVISGKQYEIKMIDDPIDFADAHLLGPGLRSLGTSIQTSNDENISSFFRTQLLPFDVNDRTSIIGIQLRDQYSQLPTQALIRVTNWLNEYAIPNLIERSLQIGRWIIWIPLLRSEHRNDVVRYMSELFTKAKCEGAMDPAITSIPVLDGEPSLYVPLSFLGGSYFSRMYWIMETSFRPEDFTCTPHLELSSGDMFLANFGDEPHKGPLKQLIQVWWSHFCSRKVRSGALLDLLKTSNISHPALDGECSIHGQVIALGRLLHELKGQVVNGLTIHAKRSGNSTVFWLGPVESP